MDEFEPTPELRWFAPLGSSDGGFTLQQKWRKIVQFHEPVFQWRDVPLVQEVTADDPRAPRS
jgi:hypothetical protein